MAVPRISRDDLKQRLDAPASERPVIVDARLKYPFEHSTLILPGAIRLSPDTPAGQTLPRDRDIVLYDSDPGDLVSERLAYELQRQGFRAFVLEGGIAEWANAKLPTDSKPAPQPATPPGAAAKG